MASAMHRLVFEGAWERYLEYQAQNVARWGVEVGGTGTWGAALFEGVFMLLTCVVVGGAVLLASGRERIGLDLLIGYLLVVGVALHRCWGGEFANGGAQVRAALAFCQNLTMLGCLAWMRLTLQGRQ